MFNYQLGKQLQQIFGKNPHVVAVYAIGSLISGNTNRESDFDLAVVVDDKRYVSDSDVYNLIQDINFPRNLDLSVVDKSSSPLFLFQIIKTGECVYKRSESDRIKFEAFALHNYYDTAHMRNIYYSYLKGKFPYADR